MNIKSRILRSIAYIILSAILLLGMVYALYFRRPIGFIMMFSSVVAIIKSVLVYGTKNHVISKLISGGCMITATALLVCFCYQFAKHNDARQINGNEVFWDENSATLFDEICVDATTDEEKVIAAYNWIIQNMDYDDTYETVYQYFDIRKTLNTKTGVCYEYANLFSAICRSQGIPCCSVNGTHKNIPGMLHTWNRVYFDGTWWSVDVTFDAESKSKKYGFQKCEILYSPDEEYIITKIY